MNVSQIKNLPKSLQICIGYLLHYTSIIYLTIRYYYMSSQYTKICNITVKESEVPELNYMLLQHTEYAVYTVYKNGSKKYYVLPIIQKPLHKSVFTPKIPHQRTANELNKWLEISEVITVTNSEELLTLQI